MRQRVDAVHRDEESIVTDHVRGLAESLRELVERLVSAVRFEVDVLVVRLEKVFKEDKSGCP